MTEKSIRDKPIASAKELNRFLLVLPREVSLSLHQEEKLKKDIKLLENIISIISEAENKEDWRNVWRRISDMNKTFGGYVGDELGQDLNLLFDTLWRDILDSYSKAKE